MNNKRSVSIYGASISGLTSALELVEKGFDVTVYELDSTAGGMAKSKMKGTTRTFLERIWTILL